MSFDAGSPVISSYAKGDRFLQKQINATNPQSAESKELNDISQDWESFKSLMHGNTSKVNVSGVETTIEPNFQAFLKLEKDKHLISDTEAAKLEAAFAKFEPGPDGPQVNYPA